MRSEVADFHARAKEEKKGERGTRNAEPGNFLGREHASAAKVSILILIVILLPSVIGETGD